MIGIARLPWGGAGRINFGNFLPSLDIGLMTYRHCPENICEATGTKSVFIFAPLSLLWLQIASLVGFKYPPRPILQDVAIVDCLPGFVLAVLRRLLLCLEHLRAVMSAGRPAEHSVRHIFLVTALLVGIAMHVFLRPVLDVDANHLPIIGGGCKGSSRRP